jgi:FKBP-type peptidyl-prolyl cis-trans isomerase
MRGSQPMGNLEVEVLIAGDGKNYPKKGQTVTNYDAFLPNGVKVDSSRKRNKPFKFILFCEQVIPGLDECKSTVFGRASHGKYPTQ